MKDSYFGEFGGCFVPELLMPPLLEVEAAMREIMPTPEFQAELDDLLRNYAGRATPLTLCPTLSEELGFNLWLKREDLLHTGAHKVNNTLGQALLAKYMGKTALVAETGAGQHGVATAAAAARLGMDEAAPYINTGVLLYNLPALRADLDMERVRAFADEKQDVFLLPDQDILTALYGDRVHLLDSMVYNLSDRILALHNAELRNAPVDLDWVRAHTVIIHYCGRLKPWKPHYVGVLDVFYHELMEEIQK